MKPRISMSKKTILFSILFIVAFGAFQKICQWDIADKELSNYPKSISVLFSSSSKFSSDGTVTNIRKTQTYVLIPISFDIPFTVSIQSDNGIITVDDDQYGVLKLLLFFFIVTPILVSLAKKFGISRIEVKG
ncbi:hypothetical protein H8K52_19850 [Undibacterium seohonense]|uniref:Uncharacterized protein n=1 Tax=Undibacterium seohonense TaxID=1344950 RepID=A0ABR6X9I9_9BURK|nr:hypothetical protein [Undibacterium seohonense]MBC3809600.1 hypothetical protein [Undibacterium seohonense]